MGKIGGDFSRDLAPWNFVELGFQFHNWVNPRQNVAALSRQPWQSSGKHGIPFGFEDVAEIIKDFGRHPATAVEPIVDDSLTLTKHRRKPLME
jgi:hypothetical protein